VIPQRNLSLLSNRLARAGGRRIAEAILERDYCLAWFLVGLSRSPLREQLLFKGGTALKRCYFGVDFQDTHNKPTLDAPAV
jgi:predicted nucleotidyltransferase component of viral defense system